MDARIMKKILALCVLLVMSYTCFADINTGYKDSDYVYDRYMVEMTVRQLSPTSYNDDDCIRMVVYKNKIERDSPAAESLARLMEGIVFLGLAYPYNTFSIKDFNDLMIKFDNDLVDNGGNLAAFLVDLSACRMDPQYWVAQVREEQRKKAEEQKKRERDAKRTKRVKDFFVR